MYNRLDGIRRLEQKKHRRFRSFSEAKEIGQSAVTGGNSFRKQQEAKFGNFEKGLSPEQQEQLRQDQQQWLGRKDAAKDQEKLAIIRARITYLQKILQEKPAPVTAVTPGVPPHESTAVRYIGYANIAGRLVEEDTDEYSKAVAEEEAKFQQAAQQQAEQEKAAQEKADAEARERAEYDQRQKEREAAAEEAQNRPWLPKEKAGLPDNQADFAKGYKTGKWWARQMLNTTSGGAPIPLSVAKSLAVSNMKVLFQT